MEAFSIPVSSINVIAANTTIAMDFDTVQDLHSNTTATSNGTGILCVLGPIALAMSYNPSTKLTAGVVLGLCNHQASRLISLVQSIAEVSHIPMMLPLILINTLNETRAHRVLGRKQAINRLEVDLGVHWNLQGDLRPRDMSLEAATRQLTMYGSEVAWDIHAIEAQLDMVTLITEVQSAVNDQNTALDDKSAAMVAFQARSRRIRQVLSGLMHWTRYNQQRIQIQLQTVNRAPCILPNSKADPCLDIQFHLPARQRPQLPNRRSFPADRRSNTKRRRAHETARRPVQIIGAAYMARRSRHAGDGRHHPDHSSWHIHCCKSNHAFISPASELWLTNSRLYSALPSLISNQQVVASTSHRGSGCTSS